jgi:hypothetical protein
MLKIALIACVSACAGGGTVAWWLKPGIPSEQAAAAAAATGMPSIAELNARADAANLPDRTVKEHF